MIEKLDPTSFDQRIQEIEQQRAAKEAMAREVTESADVESVMVYTPKVELPAPVKLSHIDLLRRALRNSSRLDSRIVWSLLHRDVYQALVSILDCNDLGVASEAVYLIYDKLSDRVDWRDKVYGVDTTNYFYEVAHGEYLGSESWARLVQSQLLHNREDMNWVGLPIVQSNRYKPVKVYHVHIRVTAYIMHCTAVQPT